MRKAPGGSGPRDAGAVSNSSAMLGALLPDFSVTNFVCDLISWLLHAGNAEVLSGTSHKSQLRVGSIDAQLLVHNSQNTKK